LIPKPPTVLIRLLAAHAAYVVTAGAADVMVDVEVIESGDVVVVVVVDWVKVS
jgi:hypothetical protein